MKKWYNIAIFNLFIVALLGLVLRYKILFPFPFFEYQNLLHAHSHFAFGGWITFLLQLIILDDFTNDYVTSQKYWKNFLLASIVLNYAMILSFASTGYSSISIALSTVSIFLSYAFCYKINNAIPISKRHYISSSLLFAALFFLLLSTLGPFALAALTAKAASAYLLHNALYFFIYFQYAGWFTFSILAFISKKCETSDTHISDKAKTSFYLITAGCVLGYFFVCSWQGRPQAITIILIAAAILQTIGLTFFTRLIAKSKTQFSTEVPAVATSLYRIALCGLILKTVIQFLTIHPAIEEIAIMYRPITIAYLHLVFLVFVSIYLLALLIEKGIIRTDLKTGLIGITILVSGVVINELLLALQAVAALLTSNFQSLLVLLLLTTIIMVIGSLLVFVSAIKSTSLIKSPLDINTKPLKINTWKLWKY